MPFLKQSSQKYLGQHLIKFLISQLIQVITTFQFHDSFSFTILLSQALLSLYFSPLGLILIQHILESFQILTFKTLPQVLISPFLLLKLLFIFTLPFSFILQCSQLL